MTTTVEAVLGQMGAVMEEACGRAQTPRGRANQLARSRQLAPARSTFAHARRMYREGAAPELVLRLRAARRAGQRENAVRYALAYGMALEALR